MLNHRSDKPGSHPQIQQVAVSSDKLQQESPTAQTSTLALRRQLPLENTRDSDFASEPHFMPDWPVRFPFRCYCGYEFLTEEDYGEHIANNACVPWKEVKIVGSVILCICNVKFGQRGSLFRHLRTRHCKKMWPEGSRLLTCICGATFNRPDNIRRHQQSPRCARTCSRRGITKEQRRSTLSRRSARLQTAESSPDFNENLYSLEFETRKQSRASRVPMLVRESPQPKQESESADEGSQLRVPQMARVSNSPPPRVGDLSTLKLPPIREQIKSNWVLYGCTAEQESNLLPPIRRLVCPQDEKLNMRPAIPKLVVPTRSIPKPIPKPVQPIATTSSLEMETAPRTSPSPSPEPFVQEETPGTSGPQIVDGLERSCFEVFDQYNQGGLAQQLRAALQRVLDKHQPSEENAPKLCAKLSKCAKELLLTNLKELSNGAFVQVVQQIEGILAQHLSEMLKQSRN